MFALPQPTMFALPQPTMFALPQPTVFALPSVMQSCSAASRGWVVSWAGVRGCGGHPAAHAFPGPAGGRHQGPAAGLPVPVVSCRLPAHGPVAVLASFLGREGWWGWSASCFCEGGAGGGGLPDLTLGVVWVTLLHAVARYRYVALLEASVLVPQAASSVEACRKLQVACAASDDWRLRFGAVGLLAEVLQRSKDTAVGTLALKGEVRAGERVANSGVLVAWGAVVQTRVCALLACVCDPIVLRLCGC
jgi:hypothetical protein